MNCSVHQHSRALCLLHCPGDSFPGRHELSDARSQMPAGDRFPREYRAVIERERLLGELFLRKPSLTVASSGFRLTGHLVRAS